MGNNKGKGIKVWWGRPYGAQTRRYNSLNAVCIAFLFSTACSSSTTPRNGSSGDSNGPVGGRMSGRADVLAGHQIMTLKVLE